MQNENLTRAFLSQGNLLSKIGLSPTAVVLDIISPLMDILSPEIKFSSLQHLSAQQKEQVDELVTLFCDLDLTFKQQAIAKSASFYLGGFHSTQVQYQLMPDISLLVNFADPLPASASTEQQGANHKESKFVHPLIAQLSTMVLAQLQRKMADARSNRPRFVEAIFSVRCNRP